MLIILNTIFLIMNLYSWNRNKEDRPNEAGIAMFVAGVNATGIFVLALNYFRL